jgi:hypothetical protein
MYIFNFPQQKFKFFLDKLFWKKPAFTIGFLILISSLNMLASTYYISPSGEDINNPGTIDLPFQTITRAIQIIVAGDTIYVRGGTHTYTATINISKSGTITNRCYLLAYPGERPLLDFSSQGIGLRGIKLSANYWHIRGIDVKGAGDNGMNISKSYNIVEFCSFFENRDTGLQLSGGASYNQIINCDSYFNLDPPDEGDADGFSPKMDVGTGNYFFGCRSWQNSDDGFDGYLRPSDNITTTYENCWCFMNGYRKDGTPSLGNGNGFKMGGSDDKTLMHNAILKNCVAFDNRVKGFDQNNNKGSMTLYNCTAYRNGTNYGMSGIVYTDSGNVMTITNCVALGAKGSIWTGSVQQTNSWMTPFVVNDSDFISIDTSGVRGPRKADGSLPDLTFMHLTPGSDLIDAGTDVGIPFIGSAPDLGAFETKEPDDVKDSEVMPTAFKLNQNYPNPFNPETKISYSLAHDGYITLKVYNMLGQEVATLFAGYAEAGRMYSFNFRAKDLSSGLYFYKLKSDNNTDIKKLILLK